MKKIEKCVCFVSLLVLIFCFVEPILATTLRVGASSRPPGLGNPYDSISTIGSHTRAAILDGMVRQGPNGAMRPGLALSWKSTSNLTWEFQLRPGAVFSNGEAADAEAAKATIDFLTQPDSIRYLIARELRSVERVEVLDKETLLITTKYADAILHKRLSLVMIVPPHAFADMGLDAFAQSPIGTGSYTLEDWGLSTGRTILKGNTTSWRPPEQIDRVEIIAPLRDSIVRLQALRSRQVDITLNISIDEMSQVESEGFSLGVKLVGTVQSIALPNVGNSGSPLQDVRVRQALNYAINKELITKIILGGTTFPTGQGAIPSSFGYDPTIKPYPYDPERAQALLAEAGYGNGFALRAEMLRGGTPTDDAVYVQIAQDLAKIGVTMGVHGLIGQEWIRKFFSGDWGDADVLSMTWSTGAYSDTIRAIETFSCNKPGAFFCAPELLSIIESSNQTFNATRREQHLRTIMGRLHNLAPSIFLYPHSIVIAHDPSVRNVVVGSGGFMFERMRVTKKED
ncbi:MAG: ABC transporter substrate-binding protein [Rhodospirillaceae bacterium]